MHAGTSGRHPVPPSTSAEHTAPTPPPPSRRLGGPSHGLPLPPQGHAAPPARTVDAGADQSRTGTEREANSSQGAPSRAASSRLCGPPRGMQAPGSSPCALAHPTCPLAPAQAEGRYAGLGLCSENLVKSITTVSIRHAVVRFRVSGMRCAVGARVWNLLSVVGSRVSHTRFWAKITVDFWGVQQILWAETQIIDLCACGHRHCRIGQHCWTSPFEAAAPYIQFSPAAA